MAAEVTTDSRAPHFWWDGDASLTAGYLLGLGRGDGALFEATLQAIPESAWPEVLDLLNRYLSTSWNGRIPEREGKRAAIAKERERRRTFAH